MAALAWLRFARLAGFVVVTAAAACSPAGDSPGGPLGDEEPGPLPWSKADVPHLPQDDVLRVSDLQVLGTHNSYHVETAGNTLADWHYTLEPLDVQLGEQGVRQLEIDLHYTSPDDDFEVYHLTAIDEGTTCRRLRDCLTTIAAWSGEHPGHLPLYLQFEPKGGYNPGDPEGYFGKLEAEILSVFARERIITPDEVQGDASSLGDAIAARGWPTLGELRGRVLLMFDNHGDVRDAYSRGGTSLEGRLLFVDSAPGDATAAITILNDPTRDADAIGAALAANMLVRTMVDDPKDDDATAAAELEAGLSVGATWLSTNFPAPSAARAYSTAIPEGAPARCNPITAPPSCAPQDLERLAP